MLRDRFSSRSRRRNRNTVYARRTDITSTMFRNEYVDGAVCFWTSSVIDGHTNYAQPDSVPESAGSSG